MARPWSLSVVVLSLLLGAAPVGAQSPSPGASPGPGASEVSSASPEPSPSGEPEAGPVGMPWDVTLEATGEDLAPVPGDVTAWRGGFAMLDGRVNPWVRLSADGTSWSARHDLGRPRVGARIAPYGGGLIVAGVRDGDLVAWTSPDGQRWRRMDGPPIFTGIPARNVEARAEQLVTVGDRTLLRGVVECPEAICAEHGRRLWGLTRGGRWEELPIAVTGGRIRDVFAGHGRFLATVDGSARTDPDLVVASRDGQTWRQVGTLPADAANRGVLVGETSAGFVVVDPWLADGNGGGTISTSADGLAWTVVWTPPDVADLEWQRLAVDGEALLVTGYASLASGDATPDAGPWAVVSADAGATWTLSAGWPSTAGGCFRAGALLGATAVAVGECGSAGRAWVGAILGIPAQGVGGSLTGPIDPADVPYEYACKGLRFTASDVAAAPDLAVVDPEGLETVRSIASRDGWPELTWRRVATNGVHTLVYGTDGTGPRAMVVYGIGGVLVAASDKGLCARAPGFSATGWVSLDPTKPAPGPDSRVLHLRSPGCADQHGLPARITMLPGHVLLRVQLSGSASEVGCGGLVRFDVKLPRPLGDRRIWNAAHLPLKELTR